MNNKEKLFIDINIKIIDVERLNFFRSLTSIEKIGLIKKELEKEINQELNYIVLPTKKKDLSFWKTELLEELEYIINYNDLEEYELLMYNICQILPLRDFFFMDPSLYLTHDNFINLTNYSNSFLPKVYYGEFDLSKNEVTISDSYVSYSLSNREFDFLLEDLKYLTNNFNTDNSNFISDILNNHSKKNNLIFINKII